jgi:peptide-methionine (R)-S-oxide reductase
MNGSNPERIPLYDIKTGRIEDLPVIRMSDGEWKSILSPASFEVTRLRGTEPAFSGEYYAAKAPGIYTCVCCGTALFVSRDKYDSGSGWPSFTRPVSDLNVIMADDLSHGMIRTEVRCRRCGAHLGHVFDDGPAPTGRRYCINSLSLSFVPGLE